MNNPFDIEVLLKDGRGLENSGVKVPQPKLDINAYHSFKDGVVTHLPHGASRETAPLPGGGTYTQTFRLRQNGHAGTKDTYSASTPDGGKVTVHGDFPNYHGHGNFTADIKKPGGSSEHVRQWISGRSASSHGVHTRRDAAGNFVSRFQIDNIRNWNSMVPSSERFTHNNIHGYHAPTPSSAPSARWSTPASRQARTPAQSQTTGGEVGGKEGHPFHGNQFTAHGTQVAVKNPQVSAKKSLSGSDFATDNLIGW